MFLGSNLGQTSVVIVQRMRLREINLRGRLGSTVVKLSDLQSATVSLIPSRCSSFFPHFFPSC